MAKIQPGLRRITQLVENLALPWQAIHVAGTNGKGSICHYASSLLSRKHIKCGKFTSPHLVDRWDCISINNKPVDENLFRKVEQHYIQLNVTQDINASPFEILTATAFHLFTELEVSVGIVEVGLGGRLDATNVLQNQAISVISKIARDHENFLGNNLAEIALHKAGILRPSVPYIIHPQNEWNVESVIDAYAKEIGAGPRIPYRSARMKYVYKSPEWSQLSGRLRPVQLDSVLLAVIAVQEATKRANLKLFPKHINSVLNLLHKDRHQGRFELARVQALFGSPGRAGRTILVDGAHNPDAAQALAGHVSFSERQEMINGMYPPSTGWPVTWVLAMTEGKDARQYLQHLLRPGDNVVTTSFGPVDGMPWVKPMDPKELLAMAQSVQPVINGVHIPEPGPFRALCAAKHLAEEDQPIVLTGSLYLVGDFHRELRSRTGPAYWTEPQFQKDRENFSKMMAEERIRVNIALSGSNDPMPSTSLTPAELTVEQKKRIDRREKRIKLQEQIEILDKELERLSETELSLQPPLPSLPPLDRSALAQHASQSAPAAKHQHRERDQKPGHAPGTPKMQQYADMLDDIRVKLQVLQDSANVISQSYSGRLGSGLGVHEAVNGAGGRGKENSDGHPTSPAVSVIEMQDKEQS